MEASTLFIVSIALLMGLSALAVANYIGLFSKRSPSVEVKKEEPVMVLVANSDLQKGVGISAADVRVRELYPDERSLYDQNRGKFMPPFISAANMRVPKDNIRADYPLLRTQFVEDPPDPMSLRIRKGMRAVNVAVTKERSAGGVIQVGEYVDVYLTSKIGDMVDPNKTYLKTAPIARECRVIMKRNSLLSMMASDPAGAPINFVLEANPYRSALIEYAQYKGQLSLAPVKTELEQPLDPRPRQDDDKMPRSYSDMKSKEYRDEDQRVDSILKGELVIGDSELERIFQVYPPAPKIPPITVTRITGVNPVSKYSFDRTTGSLLTYNTNALPDAGGKAAPPDAEGPGPGGAAAIGDPTAKKDCPTCGKNKKQADPLGSFAPVGGPSFSMPR